MRRCERELGIVRELANGAKPVVVVVIVDKFDLMLEVLDQGEDQEWDDGQCEESVRPKSDVSGARKSDCG